MHTITASNQVGYSSRQANISHPLAFRVDLASGDRTRVDIHFKSRPRQTRLENELHPKAQGGPIINKDSPPGPYPFGVALSPQRTPFAPLLYSGRMSQGFRTAAEVGFHAVELSLRSTEEVKSDELKDLLDQFDLSLAAIATGRSCIEDTLCLCNPDAEIRNRVVQRIKSIIQFAAPFNAPVIIGGIRGRLEGTAIEQSHQREAAVDSIRECVVYAKDCHVSILIEPINRYETNFINTVNDGITLLDQISEPSAKLLLDTFHMNIEEVDISASIQSAGTRLGYIHFADNNRLAPGQGHIDFTEILQSLISINYHGIITVEILPLPDDATAMHQASAFLKTLNDQISRNL